MCERGIGWLSLCLLLGVLAGCGGSGGSDSGGDNPGGENPGGEVPDPEGQGRVFTVAPGEDATQSMVDAMIQLKPKDVLQFECGFFELDQGLLIQATEDVTIQGCGKDKTVLSFRDSVNVTGLEALNVRG
ncbi:MAG: parallel beta-helix domain-containing protein, partial [Alloalcanivorax xenomutans]